MKIEIEPVLDGTTENEVVKEIVDSLPENRFLAFFAIYESEDEDAIAKKIFCVQIGCNELGITRRGVSFDSALEAKDRALALFDTIPFGAEPFDVAMNATWKKMHGGVN